MLVRIAALTSIFLATTIAWGILGATVFSRTGNSERDLSGKVASIWGVPQEQKAPSATYLADEKTRATSPLPLESSLIRVSLDLDHRQKGLLWYSTYRVDFQA